MSGMYFEKEPQSASRPVEFGYTYRGEALRFFSDSGVFSKGEVDFGTDVLLKALPELHGRVLDLGCGYGAVGISAGKAYDIELTMSDVNRRALSLAEKNAQLNHISARMLESDGFEGIEGLFDFILTNPPIRAGKETIYRLFKESGEHLAEDGQLILVIRKQQGAQSAEKYLKTIFECVDALDKSGGFWVLRCKNKI